MVESRLFCLHTSAVVTAGIVVVVVMVVGGIVKVGSDNDQSEKDLMTNGHYREWERLHQ